MIPGTAFCGNCHWWLEPYDGGGECHRHAPAIVRGQVAQCGAGDAEIAVWPTTYGHDRCGDWVQSRWPEVEE